MTATLERKEYCKQRAELIKYWLGREGRGRWVYRGWFDCIVVPAPLVLKELSSNQTETTRLELLLGKNMRRTFCLYERLPTAATRAHSTKFLKPFCRINKWKLKGERDEEMGE